ncbi:MAG: hypothetical protein WBJ36_07295 [Tenuifilum sp.]|uniref:hypothetical protein n=1 Tax=Tenuifilum sp. TaxID=2760880 RepID=UPI003CB24B0D
MASERIWLNCIDLLYEDGKKNTLSIPSNVERSENAYAASSFSLKTSMVGFSEEPCNAATIKLKEEPDSPLTKHALSGNLNWSSDTDK